jgi:hypothetical protein
MTKDEALAELQKPIYNNEVLEKDYAFVLKKFGLSHDEFENLMKQPRREHREFKYIKPVLETYPFLKVLKPLWNIIKAK